MSSYEFERDSGNGERFDEIIRGFEFDNLAPGDIGEPGRPSVADQELAVAMLQVQHLDELRASPFSTYEHILGAAKLGDSEQEPLIFAIRQPVRDRDGGYVYGYKVSLPDVLDINGPGVEGTSYHRVIVCRSDSSGSVTEVSDGFNKDEANTVVTQALQLQKLVDTGVAPDYSVAHGTVHDISKSIRQA